MCISSYDIQLPLCRSIYTPYASPFHLKRVPHLPRSSPLSFQTISSTKQGLTCLWNPQQPPNYSGNPTPCLVRMMCSQLGLRNRLAPPTPTCHRLCIPLHHHLLHKRNLWGLWYVHVVFYIQLLPLSTRTHILHHTGTTAVSTVSAPSTSPTPPKCNSHCV